MAKRFTDTNKYKKSFIRCLPGAYKLLWDYLYHDCDHAGLWIVDFEVAQIYLGADMKVNKQDALKYFNEGENRIIEVSKNIWFIPSFIEFQYGSQLSKGNNIFKSVDKMLEKYNLYQYLDVEIVEIGTTISSLRGRISSKAKDKIFLESEFTCQYCSEQKPKAELVVDHFIPLNRGGDNSDDNLVCSCVRCNSHKTDLMPEVFLAKNHNFLKPSENIIKKLKAPSKKLEGANSTLLGAKDKDKDMDKDKYKDKETDKDKIKDARAKKNYDVDPEFPEYKDSMKAYFDFYKAKTGVNPSIKTQDGAALKKLILHFRGMTKEGQSVVEGLIYIFNHWQKLDDFTQKQIDISKIYTNINSIISQLKTPKKNGNTNTSNTDYESTQFRDSMFAKIDKAFAGK